MIKDKSKNKFDPDWTCHPIYMIISQLIECGISQKEFFEKTNLTEDYLYALVDDAVLIDRELAEKIAKGCRYSADMILNLQKIYVKRLSKAECVYFPNRKELEWLE